MPHIYGPVPSRRLGRSVGIDVVPPLPDKTCNYNCVYCQLGRTTHMTNQRTEFYPVAEIFSELELHVAKVGLENIDYLTFVGDGEPLLYSKIGELISKIKDRWSLPVCIITNGGLLYDKTVRDEILHADVVMPTLDAGTENQFKKINRPMRFIKFNEMVDGMIDFRENFKGEIWYEFMAIKDVNDDDETLKRVSCLFKKIKPDRIYVNVPIRPPTEKWVKIPEPENIAKIEAILGANSQTIDIAAHEQGEFFIEGMNESHLMENILNTTKRHPMRLNQVIEVIKKRGFDPSSIILEMKSKNMCYEKTYNGMTFFLPMSNR